MKKRCSMSFNIPKININLPRFVSLNNNNSSNAAKASNTITAEELKGVWKCEGQDYTQDMTGFKVVGNFLIANGKCIYYEYIDGVLYTTDD